MPIGICMPIYIVTAIKRYPYILQYIYNMYTNYIVTLIMYMYVSTNVCIILTIMPLLRNSRHTINGVSSLLVSTPRS